MYLFRHVNILHLIVTRMTNNSRSTAGTLQRNKIINNQGIDSTACVYTYIHSLRLDHTTTYLEHSLSLSSSYLSLAFFLPMLSIFYF